MHTYIHTYIYIYTHGCAHLVRIWNYWRTGGNMVGAYARIPAHICAHRRAYVRIPSRQFASLHVFVFLLWPPAAPPTMDFQNVWKPCVHKLKNNFSNPKSTSVRRIRAHTPRRIPAHTHPPPVFYNTPNAQSPPPQPPSVHPVPSGPSVPAGEGGFAPPPPQIPPPSGS